MLTRPDEASFDDGNAPPSRLPDASKKRVRSDGRKAPHRQRIHLVRARSAVGAEEKGGNPTRAVEGFCLLRV